MDYIVLKRRSNSWIVGQSRPKLPHVFDELETFPTLRAAEESIAAMRLAQPRTVTLTFDDRRPQVPMFNVLESAGEPED